MTNKQEYQAAVIRAQEKRARLIGRAGSFKSRISPARLKADAKAGVREVLHDTKIRAKSAARRHPVAVGIVGTGLVAWLFRRPIARLIGKLRTSQPEPAPLPPVESTPPASVQPLPAPDPVAAPEGSVPPPPEPVIEAPVESPLPENHDEK